MIKNLSRRIEWLTSRAETMTTSNLEERLYRVLTTVAREHGVKSPKDSGRIIQQGKTLILVN